MKRLSVFMYGVFSYLAFFVTFLYLIAFIGNLVVPKTIDSGLTIGIPQSAIIDLGLLSLFAIQHTLMARPGFKRWWTTLVPEPIERSTYVLATSISLALLCWQWRPMKELIWNVDNATGKAILFAFFFFGWGLALLSSFVINHFDLFGLRQVWFYLRNQKYSTVEFQMKSLYKYIRHPLVLGIIVGSWVTPRMTMGHLLLAVTFTAYILVGIQFEEHDLVHFFGENYTNYRRRVPMLIPFTKKRKSLD